MRKIIILYHILVFVVAVSTSAATRLVPSQYPTIQAAIDDANDVDTIIVQPGRYTGSGNRDIDFKGKAITLRSENGPQNCVIDCNAIVKGVIKSSHRGFYFHHGEDANSVLDGFTVINGFAIPGGGILCDGSSPIISNCWIIGCSAGWGGRSCYGGGICCGDGTTIIVKCKIGSNFATLGGGVAGGKLINCIISGNRALICGGGVYYAHSMSNCIISGNTAGTGGGVYAGGTFTNCTITGNLATYKGGGIFGGVRLVNCILWGNSASEIKGNAVVNYIDIKGGWPGEGNIDADPCFVKLGYWDPNGTPQDTNDDFWVDGDYHLKSQAGHWDANEGRWTRDEVTSPCIDAGNPSSPIGLEPFPNGGIINMGAYGGTGEASKSYFGEPVCETIVAGDINGDCRVDFEDLALMALHWLGRGEVAPPEPPPRGR